MGSHTAALKRGPSRSGQVIVILALLVPVLLLFTGLAIDYGIAYADKTALSKAVDAAALEGARNLSQGQTVAKQLANDSFNANVQAFGTYSVPPTFTFNVATDASGSQTVTVTGTVHWQPAVLRWVLPSTVDITETASAGRPPLYLSIVLDQSYSMTQNGGSTALAPAVNHFITQFDDTRDHASVVSFATYATIGTQMHDSPPFQAKITSYVNKMTYTLQNAYTFAQTGLDNGLAQINSANPPANAIKAEVFFTDGWPNMIQDDLNCTGGANTTKLNFTECDQGDVSLNLCNSQFPLAVFTTTGGNATCGGCTSFPSYTTTDPCYPAPAYLKFKSQQYNANEYTNMTNISNEAFYRAEASALTAQNQGVMIFSIGLGTSITGQAAAQSFLYQVANDPNSPTFNANLPQGKALFAPTSAQLDGLFQQIATKILLRLTS